MEALDDVARLAHLDRTGMLLRAGGCAQWFDRAEAATARCMPALANCLDSDRAGETRSIGLQLPWELTGIGRICCRLAARAGIPARLLPQEATPGDIRGLDILLDACAADVHANRVNIRPLCTAQDHPAQTLLTLWGLVRICGETGPGLQPESILGQLRREWSALRESSAEQRLALATPTAENPAKQAAVRLLDRLPLFWGGGLSAGLAFDWAVRQLWYAERMALAFDPPGLSRGLVMARMPGYWANTAVLVHLQTDGGAQDATGARAVQLLARRRFVTLDIAIEPNDPAGGRIGDPALAAAVTGLAWGEWLGIYAALLYYIDPADRAPLDLLFG